MDIFQAFCSLTQTGDMGSVLSQNYPGTYLNSQSCEHMIMLVNTSNYIKLKFNYFNIELSGCATSASQDHLEVSWTMLLKDMNAMTFN